MNLEPTYTIKNSTRVLRGGSWNNSSENCRVANRNNNNPSNSNNNNGLRLAVSAPFVLYRSSIMLALLFSKTRIVYLSILIMLLGACSNVHASIYAVIIGVNQYDGSIPNLNAARDDAMRMYQYLRKNTPSDNIILLTDEKATKENILNAMNIYRYAKPGDAILFYFSGHGAPGFFCPTNISYGTYALYHSEIKSAFRKSKAKTKIVFADACYAGTIQSRESHSQNDAELTDGNRILVFMSSRSTETSLEQRYLDSGLYTYYLIKGLTGAADDNSNRKITAWELFRYVKTNVAADSRHTQNPVMYGKFSKNFIIAKY